jgi:type II secretory pathway pseudopilin PulG
MGKLHFKNKKLKTDRGFTLVEILVAVSLFIVVATISIGAILTVYDANRKAQSTKTVMDNLNLSLENMTRTVRFGNYYYCGVSSTVNQTSNCPLSSGGSGSDSVSVTFNAARTIYRLCGNAIKRSDNGDKNCSDTGMQSITSPETVIQYLRFYVSGTGNSGPDQIKQPYVMAIIKGYVGEKQTSQTSFFIETLMSQRILDI